VTGPPPNARLVEYPCLPYARGLELMRGLARVKAADAAIADYLILAEHESVITLGRRGTMDDISAPDDELAARKVSVHQVERGGLATWHGPGQIVVYPVLGIERLGLGVAELVTRLEEAAMAAAGELGIAAGRRPGQRGVWAGDQKLGSVGLAVKRGVTMHGLSINYGGDLAGFSLITPCGITGVTMTSLSRLAGREVGGEEARELIKRHLGPCLALELGPAPASELERQALAA